YLAGSIAPTRPSTNSSGRNVRHWLASAAAAPHQTAPLIIVQSKNSIRHPKWLRDALPHEFGIWLTSRAGQRRGQQVESHVGIEGASSRRKKQAFLSERRNKCRLGNVCKWIVGQARLMR